MSLNTVILVKGLNREKFCPGATSFLTMGSSVYVAGVCAVRLDWSVVRSGNSPPQPIKQVSIKELRRP
jgi:hypothetical protein